MPPTIEDRVQEVADRARNLSLRYGLAVTLAIVVAAALAIGAVDYVFRVQDTGVRIILTITWVAISGWTVRRFLWPALHTAWPEVVVAQMIERRFPHLRDRLSTAIAFLAQPESDATAGSVALRRAVISETTAAIDSLNLVDATDREPTRRAMGILAGVVVVLLAIGLVAPGVTGQATARLVLPLSYRPWPLVHQLKFTQRPNRIASGDDFEARLVDAGGNLPETVKIYFWHEGEGEEQAKPFPMIREGDAMVHRLRNVTRPFKYRAVGGDHRSMPWIELKVVEPPYVVDTKLRLIPPAYTAWPDQTDVARGSLRVLEGTRIELDGRAAKPLSSVAVHVQQGDQQQVIAGAIDGDRRKFHIPGAAADPWVARLSGQFFLEVADADGLKTGKEDRWAIRVITDGPPTLSLPTPEDSPLVTSQALIPVTGIAKDDLAIHNIQLQFSRSDQSEFGEQTVTLYEGPERVGPRGQPTAVTKTIETRAIEYDWDLTDLQLAPGTILSYRLTAADYKPQSSQTMVRRLTVVTDDELQDHIVRRQSLLLARLAEVLERQQQARQQVAAVEIRIQESLFVDKPVIDRLHGAELSQRRIVDSLVGEGDSVLRSLETLARQLLRNRLRQSNVQQRLNDDARTIRQLRDEHLDVIQHQLITALKGLQSTRLSDDEPAPVDAAVRGSLAAAGMHQQAVIETLQQLLQKLSHWDGYRRFQREIVAVRRQQETITQSTTHIGSRTVTRDFASLPAGDRAELRATARRQSELSRRLDKALVHLAQSHQDLRQSDPAAAEAVDHALESVRQAAVSGLMRQASRKIEQNQMGLASKQQQEIDVALRQLLAQLANRGQQSLDQQLAQQREAARNLREIRSKQHELSRRFAAARQQSDSDSRRWLLRRLVKRQRLVAEEARELARQLQTLQAQSASQHASQGARHGEQAAQAGEESDADAAQQYARSAEQQLDRAQEELDKQSRQTTTRLAEEQMARLEQLISGLVVQQRSVLEETIRLYGIETSDGELTPGQRASLTALALQQRGVAADAATVAQQLSQLATFELALDAAIQSMNRATRKLNQYDVGTTTQDFERDALAALEQISTSLKQDASQDGENQNSGQTRQGGDSGANLQQMLRRLAELKLLKIMQEDLNRRTVEMEQRREEKGGLTAEEELDVQDMSRRQGRLADIVFDLSQPPPTTPGAAAERDVQTDEEPDADLGLEGLDKQLDESLTP